MTSDSTSQSLQIAHGSTIAQASDGGIAIVAERLILDLGDELKKELRDELMMKVRSVVETLADPLVIDKNCNIIGNAKRIAQVDGQELRTALEAYSRRTRRTPNQLPMDLPTFTGRSEQLRRLEQLADAGSPARLISISGMGGVGKSSLAVHFAHQHGDDFTDGVLWADLRAQTIESVLDGIAREYGVNLGATDKYAKAAAVRSLLASRHVLVILDNADQVDELQLMIPAIGPSVTLVTTRRHQMRALDSAVHIELDVFTEYESFRHIQQVFGAHQDDPAWKEDAQVIAAVCGSLPLALDIAARLFKRMATDRDRFASLIRESTNRNRMLDDRDRSLTACFDVTWTQLEAEQRSLLTSAAVLEGATFNVDVLAHLTETRELLRVRLIAGELVDFSMLGINEAGRYSLHPLVREFALEKLQARGEDYAVAQRLRAADYFAAMVQEDQRESAKAPVSYERTLLDLDNVVSAWQWCLANEYVRHSVRFGNALTPLLFGQGYWTLCNDLLTATISVTRHLPDVDTHLAFRLRLGELLQEMADYDRAAGYIESYVEYYRQHADPKRLASGLRELGELRRVQRNFPLALELHMESLAIRKTIEDLPGEAQSQHDCGLVERICGHYAVAAEYFKAAIGIATMIGNQSQACYSNMELGIIARIVRDRQRAATLLQDSREIFAKTHDKRGEAYALRELGQLAVDTGDHPAAVKYHLRGLQLRRELGDRRGEAVSYHCLGYVYEVMDDLVNADRYFRQSLEITEEIGDFKYAALSKVRLGEVMERKGDLTLAREYWSQGLASMNRLGLVDEEAELAHDHLARTAPDTD